MDHDFAPFRALSFDCYGTLIDWETGLGDHLARWAQGRGLETGRDELIELVARFETFVETEHPTMRYPDVLGEVLMRIAGRLGVTPTADECRAFGASVGAWPAFADSPAALARLARRFRLVILSNVDRASFALSNARLGVEFDLVLTAEDLGSYKPDPRNFAGLVDAVGELGIGADQLLHVAQSLYHDHVPARAAGLASVWIDRRHAQPGFGATPAPAGEVRPRWRFPSLAAFADAAAGPDS